MAVAFLVDLAAATAVDLDFGAGVFPFAGLLAVLGALPIGFASALGAILALAVVFPAALAVVFSVVVGVAIADLVALAVATALDGLGFSLPFDLS